MSYNFLRNLILNIENVIYPAIIPFRPDMTAVFRVDKLRGRAVLAFGAFIARNDRLKGFCKLFAKFYSPLIIGIYA